MGRRHIGAMRLVATRMVPDAARSPVTTPLITRERWPMGERIFTGEWIFYGSTFIYGSTGPYGRTVVRGGPVRRQPSGRRGAHAPTLQQGSPDYAPKVLLSAVYYAVGCKRTATKLQTHGD